MSNAAASSNDEKKRGCSVAPFTIEADHPRNMDLLIQCIPGAHLRSRITSSRTVIDYKTGEELVPTDQARHLGTIPEIPGMRLQVNPARRTYKIIDPLASNPELCDKIQSRWNAQSISSSITKLRGVSEQSGTLDVHRMKSLCWELFHILQAGEARLVDGALPQLNDIEEMEGHRLLNPGSRIANTQPQFVRDWDEWVENLNHHGG